MTNNTTTTNVACEGSQSPPTTTQSATINTNIDNSNSAPLSETNAGETSSPNNNNDDNNNNNNNNNNPAISQEDDSVDSTYHLKWIQWNSGKIPIVMQSKNGPCPLIATINVLLLREKVKFPNVLEQITANQLFTYLGECIMDCVPPDDMQNDESAILNLEQNIHDAIEILPKLRTGLDVNIRFTGITDFEYTPECIIFDLLRIPLYHGWLSDPDLYELQNAIGNQSYNQLVDNIITNKNSTDPETQTKVLIAEEFLEKTASQLTQHGLNELKSRIKDNEIGILFRNNHFLTLLKRGSEIYTLVTDHGYLTEDNIIWETLDNIEGAGRFFDSNFQIPEMSNKQAHEYVNNERRSKRLQQMDLDFLLALSLREDESITEIPVQESSENVVSDDQPTEYIVTTPGLDDDFELAKRLQAEEEELYQEMLQKEAANKLQLHSQQQPYMVENGPTDDNDQRNILNQRNPNFYSSTDPIARSEDCQIPSTTATISSEPLIRDRLELENPVLNKQESEQLPINTSQLNSGNDTTVKSNIQRTSTYSEVVQQHQQPQHQIQYQDQLSSDFQNHQQQQQPHHFQSQQQPQTQNRSTSTTNRHRQRNEKSTKESNCIVN